MNTTHTHTPSLQTRNLVKNFGHVVALRGISLNIASGQSVAIMGPSGSGKSTLLHCLSGVLPPTSGHVWLNGKDISEASDKIRSKLRLNTCGFVFQDGQLVPELSARENVAIPLLLQGKKRTEAFTIADQWLDRLGIFEQKDRRPGDMSGGQM
ncbi:ABC transporter ATP-binding protein [Actinotignum urinale]|nr:ATP-binding cassette domain-containing protein [Actinotignum urinale]MDY5133724.1 ATP-binding cassette domain-containing protein [Actinotignum urinale]